MESVEVVAGIHRGVQPDPVWRSPHAALHGAAGFRCKGECSAHDMERVILLVAQAGHVPGQLVNTDFNVLEVLIRQDY